MSHEMDGLLAELDKGDPSPLYVLVGEEFLIRKSADELVKKLLPDALAGLNLSVMDGASPREVAQELATLPLFPGRKVVLVRDPEFLAPKKGKGDALTKARDAWKAGRRKEGARRLLALAARAGWGVAELDPAIPGAPGAEQWKEELNVDLADADLAFLSEVATFCRDENITAPEGDATPLLELFDKGVPKGQVLVLASSEVDAKNPLLKLASSVGRLVERKFGASRMKDLDLSAVARELLAPFGKRLGPGAEDALKDRIGANVRALQSELEKLAVFTDGPVILADDVRALVARVRDEEFLELSDALQKRDLASALRYVQDALGQGTHALMLLGAVTSITRTLLENHERVRTLVRGPFRMSVNEFKSRLFPQIEREVKESKGRAPNPFAVYYGMQAAARYGRNELLDAMVACAEADLALKSSGNGRLVLEGLLFKLCGQRAA